MLYIPPKLVDGGLPACLEMRGWFRKSRPSRIDRYTPHLRSTYTLSPFLCYDFADKGSDEPSAEGNVDGSPRDNDVYENVIFSEKDHVWKMEDAHDNTFTVSQYIIVHCKYGLSVESSSINGCSMARVDPPLTFSRSAAFFEMLRIITERSC